MKKLITILISLVAVLALASPLYASGDKKDKKLQAGAMQTQSAEDLEGLSVVSQDGEKIGKITSVTADEQSGQIQFVTISRGGILGMGGEDIAVLHEALRIEEDQATLTVDRSMLDNVPQQGELSAQEFRSELESHYGVSPAWEQETGTDDPTKATDMDQKPDMDSPGMGQGTSPDMPESPEKQQ